MSLLIGINNATSQTVLADGTIALGQVYRRFIKKNTCGIKTFENDTTSLTLQQEGIYHITTTLVGSGAEAGDITVQLFEDGVAIPSAFSTQTITTPDTELRTFVIDYFILVNEGCILGRRTTIPKTITLLNTGVGATFTSVVVDVVKEV